MILNYIPISAYSGLLKFEMKMFMNIAMLEICQLFTQGARRGHPCTLDIFLVSTNFYPYRIDYTLTDLAMFIGYCG